MFSNLPPWLIEPKGTPVHRAGQKISGYWGPHTSSIDWCEDNYVHIPYIAETWNTLSNIPFIILGIHGALYTKGLPHRTRYVLAHLGLALVGVGSFIFHATLNWHAQVLLDELPMIFVSSLCLYLVLQGGNEREWWKTWTAPGLVLVDLLISAIYFAYPNPVFHQVSYALIQLSTNLRVMTLLWRLPRNSPPRKQAASLMWSGTVIFLVGFAIWNVDNQFCVAVTDWRGQYGDVVGALTQGHAWWHLLTGLGSSRIIVGISYLTLSIEDPDACEVVNSCGFIPYVRTKRGVNARKVQ